jgi:hypothetical protein
MVDVATGHKHSFTVDVYVLTTDCTRRRLKLLPVLFTVLLFNLDERKSLYRLLLCLFYLLPGLGLLFGNAPYNLKKIIRLK